MKQRMVGDRGDPRRRASGPFVHADGLAVNIMQILGDVAVPVDRARRVAVAVVGVRAGGGGSGRACQAIHLDHLGDALQGGKLERFLLAQGVGRGAAAVGIVVNDGRYIGAVAERAGQDAAAGIVSPGQVARAVLVDDSGERGRQSGILIKISDAGRGRGGVTDGGQHRGLAAARKAIREQQAIGCVDGFEQAAAVEERHLAGERIYHRGELIVHIVLERLNEAIARPDGQQKPCAAGVGLDVIVLIGQRPEKTAVGERQIDVAIGGPYPAVQGKRHLLAVGPLGDHR